MEAMWIGGGVCGGFALATRGFTPSGVRWAGIGFTLGAAIIDDYQISTDKAISHLTKYILIGLGTNYAIAALCPTFSFKRASTIMIGASMLGYKTLQLHDEELAYTLSAVALTNFITGAFLAVASAVKYFRP